MPHNSGAEIKGQLVGDRFARVPAK